MSGHAVPPKQRMQLSGAGPLRRPWRSRPLPTDSAPWNSEGGHVARS